MASGSSPSGFLETPVTKWTTEEVFAWLSVDFSDFANVLGPSGQQLTGETMIQITDEKLVDALQIFNSWGIPGGPAGKIIKAVKDLNQAQKKRPADSEDVSREQKRQRIEPTGIINEGVKLDGSVFLTMRHETIQKLEKVLEMRNVILIRSPPYSGKTSLCKLLESHFSQNGIFAYAISPLGLRISDDTKFNTLLEEVTPFGLEKWFGKEDDQIKILIIDEAQMLYPYRDLLLWEKLKLIDGKAFNTKIIFFASYGEPSIGSLGTPYEFKDPLGADLLRCTRDECIELLHDFNERNRYDLLIDTTLQEHLLIMTKRHVGFLSRILGACLDKSMSSKELALYLLSHDFICDIASARCVPKFKRLPTGQQEVCRRLVLEESLLYDPMASNSDVEHLLKMGIIIRKKSCVEFPSPIIAALACLAFFKSQVVNLHDLHQNFTQFIFLTLQRIKPSVLQNTLGKDAKNRLLERTWQMEFYRAASSCLGHLSTVSPDVGKVFGSEGFLDFYVNDIKQWGIELTRDGNNLEEHAERPQGIYSLIDMKEYVVLDFRKSRVNKPTRKPDPIWYVVCDADYKSAKVSHTKKDSEEIFEFQILFQGDEEFPKPPQFPNKW